MCILMKSKWSISSAASLIIYLHLLVYDIFPMVATGIYGLDMWDLAYSVFCAKFYLFLFFYGLYRRENVVCEDDCCERL